MNLLTATRLQELRKMNGYSQEVLAEKLGVSRQSISKWERAESSPEIDNLMALAKIYGISVDDLLNTDKDRVIVQDPKKTDKDFKGKTRRIITNNKDDLRTPCKIGEEVYIEQNLNANAILNYSKLVVDKYDGFEDEISYRLK